MLPLLVSLASAAGRTGRGVRIAVVDSGIHASHPHVGGIAGGVVITEHGPVEGSLVDRLGHGTAVAAAIREKAPDAALLAVKIFDQSLAATTIAPLTRASSTARSSSARCSSLAVPRLRLMRADC